MGRIWGKSSDGSGDLAHSPAGLLSASSSWGRRVRAEHPESFDGFQEGGGRSSPVMSDTSGVSHSSDSGGGRGTWKGEPRREKDDPYWPLDSMPQVFLAQAVPHPPLTRQ